MTLAERKISARIQLRLGPNRVGPFGLLQPAADGVKLFFKEKAAPESATSSSTPWPRPWPLPPRSSPSPPSPFDRPSASPGPHRRRAALACSVRRLPAALGHGSPQRRAAVHPGDHIAGRLRIFLGGWAGNSKYSLLGALRSSAQLISYEMAVSFALIGPVLLAGSLEPEETVVNQQHGLWFVFLAAAGLLALLHRVLWPRPTGSPSISPRPRRSWWPATTPSTRAMRFGLYFMAEYINMITVCSIATVMFLGGWLSRCPLGSCPTGWVHLVRRQGLAC